MIAHRCDVFGQALGLVPGVCLFFEVFDAIGVALIAAQGRYGRYEVKYVGKCVRGRRAADLVKQLRVTYVRLL
ncbi:hypothetical protein GCM10010349_65680 [Streptomyces flavofungini]|nr:hypothetical protein GCM10010349_65680 [Streptomyces flavofungini]